MGVALKIISEQGIYVTTIEDVTGKADIGKGTFYQYFSSKEALLEELLAEGLSKLVALCRESLREAKGSHNAVATLTRVHVSFLTEHHNYLLLFHQVRGYLQLRHPVAPNLRKIYGQYLLDLSDMLASFFPKTARSESKAKEAALTLSAFSTGLTTHHRLFDRLLDLPMKDEMIEQKVAAGLLATLA